MGQSFVMVIIFALPRLIRVSTGLKKRITVHIPTGVRGAKDLKNERILPEKKLGSHFGGLAAQNRGLLLRFLSFGGQYLSLIVRKFSNKFWEKLCHSFLERSAPEGVEDP